MDTTQALIDVRATLMDQHDVLLQLVNAVLTLREGLVVPAPEVHVPAPIVHVEAAAPGEPVVMPAPLDMGQLAALIAQQVAPIAGGMTGAVDAIQAAVVSMAETANKREPVTIRGGGITREALQAALADALEPEISRLITSQQGGETATKFDYGERTDANPVYIGVAPRGTSEAAGGWTLTRITYDASDRALDIDVREDVAWTDRTTGW